MMFLIFLFYIDWILLKESETANICDYYEKRDPLCCPGWMKNVYGDCVKSECDQDCGYGKCVGLNVCECYDKSVRSESCPQINQKFCINNCSNKGTCLNGKCICESGYSGEDCNTTITSTCYVKINRGLCKSTPENLQLSKAQCCEIFQVAWGNPCEFCNKDSVCPKGFMRRNGQCEDIDECQFKSICLNGHCINEKGSFRCRCPPDHHLDESTMSCQYQKDPCLIYASQCGFYGRCVTKPDGQYKCLCRKPYEPSANEKSCVKNSFYNVCKLSRKLCLPFGECQPSGLSYFCNCWPGFHQSVDRKSCLANTNNDLCKNAEIAERCRGGLCISELNGYRCECYGEYKSHNNEQECIRQVTSEPVYRRMCSQWKYYSLCQGGECIDMDNDYYCKCTNGFQLAENGRRCEKNEVTSEPVYRHMCSQWKYYSLCQGGECVDTNNDYYCKCTNGFQLAENGRRCEKNEIIYQTTEEPDNRYCQLPEYSSRCRGGQCIADRNYGFKCICLPGFTVSTDGRTCEQNYVDACLTNGHNCGQGRCQRVGYSDYQCICPQYTMRSEDGKSCLTNYKTTVASPSYCDMNSNRERCATGDCIPDPDYGFRCICKSDYKVSEDGRACFKIETILSLCSKYQYQCQGGGCMDLDEYNYECQCLKDYIKSADGRSCIRTNQWKISDADDPCLMNAHKCLQGRCRRSGYNDYQCICPQYAVRSEDGKSCLINYKTTVASTNYCNVNRNRERCATGDCIPDPDYGFRCICKPDYKMSEDGRACYRIETVLSLCGRYQLQCQGGGCMELDQYNYECQCLVGFTKSVDGRSCIKTSNSQNHLSICEKNRNKCATGVCYPLDKNDYMCLCVEGYHQTEDRRACVKKEVTKTNCAKHKDRCRGGYCFDITNGYLCICTDNFVVSADGRECLMKEKFALKYHSANGVASLSQIRINDCKNKEKYEKCQPGVCVETSVGYRCVCPRSFILNENGHECNRDATKCPFCFYGCTDPKNVSKCSCPAKYEDLYDTGLCIIKSNLIKHSMGISTCNSESTNKTLVIRFNGVSNSSTENSVEVYNSVSKLLLVKQQKSVRLSFCVPIRKRHQLQKRIQRQMSADIFSWQIVCIFDC